MEKAAIEIGGKGQGPGELWGKDRGKAVGRTAVGGRWTGRERSQADPAEKLS